VNQYNCVYEDENIWISMFDMKLNDANFRDVMTAELMFCWERASGLEREN